MSNSSLTEKSNNKIGFKEIKIKDISYVDEFLYIAFDNGQKLLINEKTKKIYDLSSYSRFVEIYEMGDKLCAVLLKGYTVYFVDLDNMEVIYSDNDASFISKQDDRTIHVVKRIDKGNNAIYDIVTKKYLSSPEGYVFENSLGNNLYVFCERDYNKDFHEKKRCVINANGDIILSETQGFIELSDNHLIIIKKDELSVVGINQDSTFNIKTFKKDENIIAMPKYYDGNIVIIEKGLVKIISPRLELLNIFKIDNLEEVIDLEIVDDTLKLIISSGTDENKSSKQLYINLKNGKYISHLCIEGYPYWMPTTFIAQDTLDDDGITDLHFYDANFDFVATIPASYYENIDGRNECIFHIFLESGNESKKYLINTQKSISTETDYDIVCYHLEFPYGYGANYSTGMLDFLDDEFNILIPNIDFKKFGLRLGYGNFNYFIINDYVRIDIVVSDEYGENKKDRCIILRADGKVIMDSTECKGYPIGNFIQIIHANNDVEYLNTLTGEIGPLQITAPIDENGKIVINGIEDYNSIFSVNNTEQLLLPSSCNEQEPKVIKIVPTSKKDDKE